MTQKTTAETVQDITETITDRITKSYPDFIAHICDDGAGPYISLNSVGNAEDYRCISLTDEAACGEDLCKYNWNFWNNETNTYEDSKLGADATVEQVLEFLNKSLEKEKQDSAK